MKTESSYTVAVKDFFMIAHSLQGEVFGPAQGMHGATYHVTAAFSSPNLTSDGIVLDISRAEQALRGCLDPLRMKNLDELEIFAGTNTTTEFLCRHIHEQLASQLSGEFSGLLRVTLDESQMAWAAYEAPI
jgi:6-pyruvoyltetrahydropterin/6-carboxytetrahydropterin synthase